ncbi:MAG: 16S rRNA (guanine(527)-N(7))-methyltransferase RsmG [Ktedonobacteraceae bacterium]|nr:16S rRNA (guanine(527)-N(7))-methyltransferase RsmG [Ktedonobacteraceae bacterium]
MIDNVPRLFIDGLYQLGLQLDEQQLQQLVRYHHELLVWNTRFNLTAIRDVEEVWLKHFLDSLTVLQAYDVPNVDLLDIGTGAGFPGLALKIVRQRWHVTLVEATAKKVTFLRHVIEVLQLQNVAVLHARAEEVAHQQEYRAAFDLVTARAVASLATLLEYGAPFCRSGARMIFPKKGNVTEELAEGKRAAAYIRASLVADVPVTLAGLADGRRLLVWQQNIPCPSRFPRSGAVMAKKPLAM